MSDLNVHTTAEINALTPITGDLVIDSDLNAVKLYDGAAWKTFTTDATSVPYQNRWGVSFDGSSDYLSLGDLSTLSSASSFSISMWVDLSNWSGAAIYVPFTSGTGNSDRVCFYLNSLNEVRFGVNGSVGTCLFNLSTPVDYRNSGWHHLVGAYNGTDVTLFFDGTQVSTTTSSVPTSTSSTIGNSAAIGRETWSSSRYYNGKIDDLAIFDSALDQTAITALYGGGTPSEVTGAAGYWRMGDDSNDSATSGGSIATITDSSGNGNDATQGTASSQPTFSDLTGESIYV
jgi:hypothetical protein